jgi:hypothetical protein
VEKPLYNASRAFIFLYEQSDESRHAPKQTVEWKSASSLCTGIPVQAISLALMSFVESICLIVKTISNECFYS